MTVEKLEVLKVNLENEYYVLIVPRTDDEDIREFYLANEIYGDVMYMFGCIVHSDDEAVELALENVESGIRLYREENVG
jgi:hypothetical protein